MPNFLRLSCGRWRRESLGTQPQPSTSMPEHASEILREAQSVRLGGGDATSFTIVLTRPALRFREEALLQVRASAAMLCAA